MKKNLLFSFLVLFFLNIAAFAGLSDSKKESDTAVINSPIENKLSDEESSRLTRRADIENLSDPTFSDKDKAESKDALKAPTQVYIENHRHHGYYYGGASLLLIIVLVIVLV